MAGVYLLTPALQSYDWGTNDVIAELLGMPPTGQPLAEAWWGAHPDAPATVATADGSVPLVDLIAADASGTLGDHVAHHWDGTLPYLLKVLSISKPLSIQVHPSARQAREGYDAERQAARPGERTQRAFADRSAKPELAVALSPMVVLAGFRPVDQLARDLELLDTVATPLVTALATHAASPEPAGAAMERYLRAALEVERDSPLLGALTTAALAAAASPELQAAAAALDHHPGDPGALIALALNRVDLARGDALFIDAGVVHSYQSGTALEVMANSDNVVRAGLTSKPVNAELFLALADLRASAPHVIRPAVRGGTSVYATPAAEYDLTLVSGDTIEAPGGPRMVVALEGAARVSTGTQQEALEAGQSVFVGDNEGVLKVTATGMAAVVTVPRSSGSGTVASG